MKILIVEDDSVILEGVKISLAQEGHDPVGVSTVAEAKALIGRGFDLYIIDIMLPDGTGFDICSAIRETSDTPIIFLTACDDEVHTVLALEKGADDYITKPFRIRELMARIKAVARRAGQRTDSAAIVKIGDNELNIRTGKMFRGGEEVILTAMEYKLLLIFINNRGRVLSRQQILYSIWDVAGDFVNDNTLTVYVKRLREKLGSGGEELILTVRGMGYRLV